MKKRDKIIFAFLVLVTLSAIPFANLYNNEIKKEKELIAIQTGEIPTDFVLPCPCCGGESKVYTMWDNTEAYIECTKCGLHTDSYKCVDIEDAKKEAIKSWNRRSYYNFL